MTVVGVCFSIIFPSFDSGRFQDVCAAVVVVFFVVVLVVRLYWNKVDNHVQQRDAGSWL